MIIEARVGAPFGVSHGEYHMAGRLRCFFQEQTGGFVRAGEEIHNPIEYLIQFGFADAG
jgi:hypothetical protein